MGKVTGFMEFERLEQAHEPVAQRKTHFREFITPLSQQEAKQQAARCMDCGTPFCTFRCTTSHRNLTIWSTTKIGRRLITSCLQPITSRSSLLVSVQRCAKTAAS